MTRPDNTDVRHWSKTYLFHIFGPCSCFQLHIEAIFHCLSCIQWKYVLFWHFNFITCCLSHVSYRKAELLSGILIMMILVSSRSFACVVSMAKVISMELLWIYVIKCVKPLFYSTSIMYISIMSIQFVYFSQKEIIDIS